MGGNVKRQEETAKAVMAEAVAPELGNGRRGNGKIGLEADL